MLLDSLTTEIARLFQIFHRLRDAVPGVSAHVVENLSMCVRCAERLVRTASGMVSSRGTVPEGGISGLVELTEQQKNDIHGWIRNQPLIPEEMDQVGSEPSIRPSQVTDTCTTFDREAANLQTLRKFLRQAYNAQDFHESKSLLQKIKTRLEGKYGPNFEERSEVLGMLATTHCRLEEWESAEEIVHMDFDGREEAVKTLVWCYYQHSRWDDAERILCESIEQDAAPDTNTSYMLAEVYLAKGHYDKAIEACDRSINGVSSTLGDDHVLFYMSISLLAKIYEAQGDPIEAKVQRALLRPGVEGSPVIKMANQKSVIISIEYRGCGWIKQR